MRGTRCHTWFCTFSASILSPLRLCSLTASMFTTGLDYAAGTTYSTTRVGCWQHWALFPCPDFFRVFPCIKDVAASPVGCFFSSWFRSSFPTLATLATPWPLTVETGLGVMLAASAAPGLAWSRASVALAGLSLLWVQRTFGTAAVTPFTEFI